jgi:hypothetical protein
LGLCVFEILVSVLKSKVTVSVLSYNIDGKEGSQVRWEDKANMKGDGRVKLFMGSLGCSKEHQHFLVP